MLDLREVPELFREEWERFSNRYGVPAAQRIIVFNELWGCYSEPHRTYHGIVHPVLLFREVKDVRWSKPEWFLDEAFNASLELAVWTHDQYMDTSRKDNEKRSAGRARELARIMGFPDRVGETAERLVLATEHSPMPPSEFDEQLMVDIDLSPLAAPWEEFKQNSADIRLEYSQYSDDQFKLGRRDFMGKMLPPARPRIYSTSYFREKYEAVAVENIKRSLEDQFASST